MFYGERGAKPSIYKSLRKYSSIYILRQQETNENDANRYEKKPNRISYSVY